MCAMDQYTGEQLLTFIQHGDKEAFTVFCERYREFLLLVAFQRLGHADEAKDVVQDVLIWVWVKRSEINISAGVKAYLRGAVFNRTADLIRKNASRRARHERYMYLKEHTVDKDFLESKELAKELALAIELISPASREAFVKSFIEDKSLKVIASEMNINVQSVKNHIQRALKALRGRL